LPRELARRGASFEVHYADHSRERIAFRDAVEGYSCGRAFYYISSEKAGAWMSKEY
jgi:hypothetical protein